MASDKQKQNAISIDKFRYKSRLSYLYGAKHKSDIFKNLGFNYKGQILKKTTSPELRANPLQNILYDQIEELIHFIFDQAKMIKKSFSLAHEKNSVNIN